ncbi:GyrI-like domain-containing protein [Actinotalea sp. K2]|uniref:GyrI-like domain-containing protein n=1 Tax=Actinotalea sp. K2 TaxID=2939438 RepID=UPI00201821F4|nr:GyrI-like domain-containing protein [Actinotalea sp. K2]MCL3859590.1 GyrI-like domain-containing protein [Actinotalea sp. K2]
MSAENDPRRERPDRYRAADTPARLTVPPLNLLMVDGAGDPRSTQAYTEAVGTLYAVSYGVRAHVKEAGGTPWTVMPLEGLWWALDMAGFSTDRREDWLWTMMIAQPAVVTAEMVEAALSAAATKGRAPAADRLRFEAFDEGDAVQVMHHGPYETEGPTIAALHSSITEQGLVLRGKHHEIYLNDPRRVAPAAVRTILRQPVAAH